MRDRQAARKRRPWRLFDAAQSVGELRLNTPDTRRYPGGTPPSRDPNIQGIWRLIVISIPLRSILSKKLAGNLLQGGLRLRLRFKVEVEV